MLAVVLARTLGTAGYGAYAVALAWAMFLSVPASLGITPLVVRHVAANAQREEWGLVRGVIRWSNQVVGAAAAVVVAGAALVGLVVSDARPETVGPFLIGLLLVPVVAFTGLRQAAIQGLHRVVLARLPDTVLLPTMFLAFVFLASRLLGDRFTASWAMALNVAAGTFALLVGVVLLRRALPVRVRRSKPDYEHRSWFRSALPLLVMSLLLVANNQCGTILLGVLDSARRGRNVQRGIPGGDVHELPVPRGQLSPVPERCTPLGGRRSRSDPTPLDPSSSDRVARVGDPGACIPRLHRPDPRDLRK